MMITPTQRAMSPQDIVRIYVPPAPPDEQFQSKASPQSPHSTGTITAKMNGTSPPSKILSGSTISLSSYTTTTNSVRMRNGTIVHNSSDAFDRNSNRNSIISAAEPTGSGDITPVRRSIYRSEEELRYAAASSMSSSRRGSLSRKTPAPPMLLENKLMMECQHLQAATSARRGSAASTGSNRVQLNISLENISLPSKSNNVVGPVGRTTVMMTSFEELAKDAAFNLNRSKTATPSIIGRHNSFTPDDDNFTLLHGGGGGGGVIQSSGGDSTSRYETTIEYKSFSPTTADQRRPRQRQPSDPICSPTDYYDVTLGSSPEKLNKTIEFGGGGRFFYSQSGNNISSGERKKSSDDSSSTTTTTTTSPNANKSVVNTPVTDTVPLLLASPSSPPSSSATYRQLGCDDDDDDDDDEEDNSISSPTTTTTTTTVSNKRATKSQHRNIKNKSSKSEQNNVTPHNKRPSKIPLFHHKTLSPTSSSDSSSVLPPVEIPNSNHYTNKHISNHRRIGSGGGGSSSMDFDSRIAAPLGGAYEFNNRAHQRSATTTSTTTTTTSNGSAAGSVQPPSGIARSQDLNKIRIKINQNQRN